MAIRCPAALDLTRNGLRHATGAPGNEPVTQDEAMAATARVNAGPTSSDHKLGIHPIAAVGRMRSTITAKAIAPCKGWEEEHYRHAQLAGRVCIVSHRSMMASTPASAQQNANVGPRCQGSTLFAMASRRSQSKARRICFPHAPAVGELCKGAAHVTAIFD